VSFGAVVATVLWVAVSFGFSAYVRNVAAYNQFYGALGGVAVLMIWFWLTAFIVLVGAELNAEVEHQTRRDSTVGPPKPMGRRGAVKADTLGRVP
jgi:membrane protein